MDWELSCRVRKEIFVDAVKLAEEKGMSLNCLVETAICYYINSSAEVRTAIMKNKTDYGFQYPDCKGVK